MLSTTAPTILVDVFLAGWVYESTHLDVFCAKKGTSPSPALAPPRGTPSPPGTPTSPPGTPTSPPVTPTSPPLPPSAPGSGPTIGL